jgi:hypothetical protein
MLNFFVGIAAGPPRISAAERLLRFGAQLAAPFSTDVIVLRRFLAYVLIALAFSPFTRPFSTCDLSALFTKPITGAFISQAPRWASLDTRVMRTQVPAVESVDDALLQVRSAEPPVVGRARFATTSPASNLTYATPFDANIVAQRAAVFIANEQRPARPSTLRI